jgi:alcohol dehydrogenase YqhD (iron-dependent ADH family)
MIPLNLLEPLLLAYLAIISSMCMEISVIEPNFYGISAISHAAKLLKERKMQVLLLIPASSIISCMTYVGNYTIVNGFVSDPKAATLVLGFMYHLLQQVVSLYSMMAITVLYYECSQNNGGAGNKVEYTKLISHY